MDNVTVTVKKGQLVIVIDLTKSGSPSASGKTEVIASSRGNTLVAPGVYLGLNVFKYAEK